MKAVIPAVCIGTRLRPLTSSKPKCMVKVAGKPILQHQITAFAFGGIEEVVIIIGYEAIRIEEYCKHIKNIKIKLISNSDYENTNNMYSLYLARNDVAGKSQSFNIGSADKYCFGYHLNPQIWSYRSSSIVGNNSHGAVVLVYLLFRAL
jgi:choline kinase